MDFARCPKCMAQNWEDMPALQQGEATRFRCVRCRYIMRLGACSKCGAKQWGRLKQFLRKDGKKPIVRYECMGCNRIIGILLD